MTTSAILLAAFAAGAAVPKARYYTIEHGVDVALHPNDPGYQRMADELIRAFRQ